MYWVLQGARDSALLSIPTPESYLSPPGVSVWEGAAGVIAGVNAHRGSTPVAAASLPPAAGLSSTSSGKKKQQGRNKESTAHPTSSQEERSEIGAGRALFGGFVPSRQAPAASLYDFGGGGGGDGDYGVSALGSIYGSGGGKIASGGGTLENLGDAKVRQYTQEATARAQRLGAEKRSSRISRSKRQG